MKVIFLAAGRGVRFGDSEVPKPLIKIGNKTLIEYSLDAISQAGIKKAIIVTGYLKEQIKKRLGSSYKDVLIEYVDNDNYLTTDSMHSLYLTKNLINDDVIILESDLIYDPLMINKILDSDYKNINFCLIYCLN